MKPTTKEERDNWRCLYTYGGSDAHYDAVTVKRLIADVDRLEAELAAVKAEYAEYREDAENAAYERNERVVDARSSVSRRDSEARAKGTCRGNRGVDLCDR